MEIRQQQVGIMNLRRRMDEDVRRALLFQKFSINPARCFQDAGGCCPNRQDAPRGIDRVGRGVRDRKLFLVHFVLGNVFRLHRPERSGADVQRDKCVVEPRENFRSEMQPSGGCRDRAWNFGVNGLVTFQVRCVALSSQIWREREQAAFVQIDRAIKRDHALTVLANFFDPSGRTTDRDGSTKAHSPPWANHAFPARRTESFEKKQLHFAVVRKATRRHDTSVVENQQIARRNKIGELGKFSVFDRFLRSMQYHHARCCALLRRSCRDQFFRQHVIVIGKPGTHPGMIKGIALLRKTSDSFCVKEFRPALDLVLTALEQIRDRNDRLPRASRLCISRLHRPNVGKAELLAPIQARVSVCIKCPHLARTRTQTVFGVGNPDAEIMFIGEAPGADEDARGEPFVGRAGQLLTRIIETMGFARAEVYIANVLKCRPDMPAGAPGNRPPTPLEMQTCLPYLAEQIGIVRPKVLVALGATAVEGLLGSRGVMRELRGKWQSYEETPLMITYHPSYLLRNQSQSEKRKVWEDMLLVLERIGRPITEKQRGYFLSA